jgi:hypothetical protein
MINDSFLPNNEGKYRVCVQTLGLEKLNNVWC